MSNNNNPGWAWLGLLKWSLNYQDGTSSSDSTPARMSAEDKSFLEEVMKHGIVNEGERMKEILTSLTSYLDDVDVKDNGNDNDTVDNVNYNEKDKEAVNMLQELRDIVEQIDYARAFVALQGLPFLLGCAAQKDCVPMEIRAACVACLSTLAQNNPPVQQALLDLDGVHHLAEIYFEEDSDWNIKSKAVQSINAIVRGHEAAEEAFANDHVCRLIISTGLGLVLTDQLQSKMRQGQAQAQRVPSSLRSKCLFFLRAIICSDFTSPKRVRLFEDCLNLVIPLLDPQVEEDYAIRQSALDLILEIMSQHKSVSYIMSKKNDILAAGVHRVSHLRSLPADSEEKDMGDIELEAWESLIVEIAKDPKDEEDDDGNDTEPILMLEGCPPDDDYRNAPQ